LTEAGLRVIVSAKHNIVVGGLLSRVAEGLAR
jgi:hypothetical protein